MITSTAVQVAEIALQELATDDKTLGDVVADLFIGPMTISHFSQTLVKDLSHDPEAMAVYAFTAGVLAERFVNNLETEDPIAIDLAETLILGEEAYEGASHNDLYDSIRIAFDIKIDVDATTEELATILMEALASDEDEGQAEDPFYSESRTRDE